MNSPLATAKETIVRPPAPPGTEASTFAASHVIPRPIVNSQPTTSKRFEQPSTLNPQRCWLHLLLFIVILSACFWRPLFDLAEFAASEELYSYIFLIPFVSAYLIWLKRRDDRPANPNPNPAPPSHRTIKHQPSTNNHPAASFTLLGFAALITYSFFGRSWQIDNYLSITLFAYVCFVITGAILCLGGDVSGKLAFPFAFLFFMVPFPAFVVQGIEVFFQHTSATAAHLLFVVSGTPVYREDMSFHLPGVAIRVAEECSGIRSSLVLFVTSLVAGHLFLRSTWGRSALTAAVIPLAIIRNGFRIFTIAMLCLHVDANAIDWPIHHRGGPIFFALSLIPFFALLLWLVHVEKKNSRPVGISPLTTVH